MRIGENRYFAPGDIKGLSAKLEEFIARPLSEEEKSQQIKHIEQNYDWGKIAEKTLGVYEKARSMK